MPRLLLALAVAVALGAVAARPASAATASPAASPAARAKNAGTIEGDVIAVDYGSGTMTVQAGSRRLTIVVVPGTTIQGHDNFHTIADIQKGSHVTVTLSRRGGTFTAQIVQLR